MELYLAGNSTMYESIAPWNIHQDFNILLSYVESYGRGGGGTNQIIEKAKEMAGDKMEMYLAGNTQGNSDLLLPEKLIDDFNILLSYIHPAGHKGIDKVGEVKRAAVVDYILTDMAKMTKEERKAFMELYLVGPEKENIMEVVTGEVKANMLFNYLEGKKATDKYKEKIKPKKLFIDSGAFSAWTRGKQIDVDEYINWINERADFIDLYGQIDVIPGDRVKGHTQEQVEEAAKATWENYLYMRPKMKNPDGLLYTFHVGEPYTYLEQALEWKDDNGQPFPYMALGGMVGKPMPVKKAFLNSCFNIIKKSSNPKVKVHAFGMTSFPLLEQYPITSADSTSWIMTGANGGIMTEVGIIAVSDQMAKLPEHYSHLPKHHQEIFNELISEFGFTLDDLRGSRDNRIMFNARYMNKKALVLNSGGVDSTTCLSVAINELGLDNVSTVSVFYGQKHSKELECAKRIAEYYKVEHNIINLANTGIMDKSNCSLLAGSTEEIRHESYAEQIAADGEGMVNTYVPFRNGLMLSSVAALAMSIYPDDEVDIYIGAHADDAAGNAYADCSEEFTTTIGAAISIGTYGKVNLKAPLVNLNKAEVVREGLKLGTPYHLTWSCYEGGDKPCGTCGTCIDRAIAFKLNNITDPAL